MRLRKVAEVTGVALAAVIVIVIIVALTETIRERNQALAMNKALLNQAILQGERPDTLGSKVWDHSRYLLAEADHLASRCAAVPPPALTDCSQVATLKTNATRLVVAAAILSAMAVKITP